MPFPVTPNSYEMRGDVVYLDVATKACPGAVALIDASDLAAALDGRGRWYAYKTPSRTTVTVRRAVQIGRNKQGHQILPRLLLASGAGKPVVIHLDHDGLNNRRINLLATSKAMMAIHARHAKGKLRGVFRRGDRFRALIGVSNRVVRLGSFATEAEAAQAYDAAAREHFGDLACLNFPSPT